MPFEIGFAPRGARKVSVAQIEGAQAALREVVGLQQSDEEIRHIKTPAGQVIGIGELQLLAERETDQVAKGS